MTSKFYHFIRSPKIPWNFIYKFLYWLPDSLFVKILYYSKQGTWPNLNKPELLNEKLQWLKLHNRQPEYAIYSDKVKVKEYISKTIGERYVIPTIGVWEKAEDVNFDILPNKFVIKVNHNSGLGMFVCKDKNKMNVKQVRKRLSKGLSQNYYKCFREWPYKNIPRRIIAEEFLENADGTPIVDYKFYCFGGRPRYFMYSVGETEHYSRNCKFDMNCNNIDYLFKRKATLNDNEIKLPANFNEMKCIVEKLCVGFPHIRIDLYNVDGRIYFGEMTFYSGAGFINIDDKKYSQHLSDYIEIDKISMKSEKQI